MSYIGFFENPFTFYLIKNTQIATLYSIKMFLFKKIEMEKTKMYRCNY
jgi:hypothetical protein